MSDHRRSAGFYIALLLSAAPVAILAHMVARYAVDVPDGDQWDMIPTIRKSCEGTLALRDLWAQHNEHRILFPRLVTLAVARLAHWDVRYEMAISVVLAAALFLVWAHVLRKTARDTGLEGLYWALPIISVLVFSLAQYENWLWGFSIQIYMGVLGALVAIVLLADPAPGWTRFAGACAAATIATYSFGNGLLVWLVGLPTIIARSPPSELAKPEHRRRERLCLGIWAACGAIVAWTYLYQYVTPPWHPARVSPLSSAFWSYLLTFIGAAVSPVLVTVWGIASICLACAVLVSAKLLGISARTLLPYVSMLAFSFLSAIVGASSRAGLGVGQALTSRYLANSTQCWIPLILLVFIVGAAARRREQVGPVDGVITVRLLMVVPAAIVALLACTATLTSFVLGPGDLASMYGWRTLLRAELLRMSRDPRYAGDESVLADTYHSYLDLPRNELPFLEKHHLSLFAREKR